jgi:hypothetical protein
VTAATLIYATTEELLEAVFSLRAFPNPYNEEQLLVADTHPLKL